MSKNDSPAVVGRRTMELVVAAIIIARGAVVIADSLRVGVGWAADGPRSGYFPFRVAIIMIAASLYVIARAVVGRTGAKVFVNREELARVATVLVPTIVFVAGVFVVGIYVSAVLFIAAFMAMQGDRNLTRIGGVAVGVPVVAYLLFEMWFLVPLPKGPLEDFLGL